LASLPTFNSPARNKVGLSFMEMSMDIAGIFFGGFLCGVVAMVIALSIGMRSQ
jgi:hypothetical protein